ncbi:MAG: O-antigen ligase family protein [Polaromonas sp.]|nr:O-antigen ligase family protein [Gemmatimonadaceae bacterium]
MGSRLTLTILGSVLTASLLILLLTGDAFDGLLPALVTTIAYAVWAQPLRRTVLPLIFAECFLFTPTSNDDFVPYASGPLWDFVVNPGNHALNMYLNKVTDFSFLSLTGHELAYPLLLVVIICRSLSGSRVDKDDGRTPPANVMYVALAAELCTVAALEAWGWVRGGDMRSSLFQIRTFIWLPIQTVVIMYALRDMRDFRKAALLVTAATVLKALAGLYFMSRDVWARNYEVPYMTGHQDSVPYVAVFFLWLAVWLHRPLWRRLLLFLPIFATMLTAIVVNDRRLAWVAFVAAPVTLIPLATGRLKFRLRRTLLFASPFIVVYLVLSRSITTGIFSPGAELMGMANATDASTIWRELENTNLIYTLRQYRIFGSGWGHEYIEFISLPSISGSYAQYRLIAHNSVLWLLGVAGIVGFALIWTPIVVGVYLAARSYRFARAVPDRVAACTCVAVMACYVNQAWGDIGMATAVPTLLLACALAAAARLARETGAWPGGMQFTNSGSVQRQRATTTRCGESI